MDIDYTVAALMFPAIPLMMTMYGHRYHTLSALIRRLHDQYIFEKRTPPEWEKQLHVLNNRTNLLKYTMGFAAFGFLLILVLAIRKITGAIIIGVLIVTIFGLSLGLIEFNGIVSSPPDIRPTLMKFDIIGAIDITMISIIISFLFVWSVVTTNGSSGDVLSNEFQTNYYRASLQGIADVGRLLMFENFTNHISLLFHSGLGFSMLESDLSFDGNNENMVNFMFAKLWPGLLKWKYNKTIQHRHVDNKKYPIV